MTLLERIKAGRLPQHVALIMDGNGRWAQARGLPRTAGHRAGAVAAERLIRFAGERIGLKHMTLFAFSSENWKSSGIPVDPSYGNRGWGIVVRDRNLAGYFELVFLKDSNPVYDDVVEFGFGKYGLPQNFSI